MHSQNWKLLGQNLRRQKLHCRYATLRCSRVHNLHSVFIRYHSVVFKLQGKLSIVERIMNFLQMYRNVIYHYFILKQTILNLKHNLHNLCHSQREMTKVHPVLTVNCSYIYLYFTIEIRIFFDAVYFYF